MIRGTAAYNDARITGLDEAEAAHLTDTASEYPQEDDERGTTMATQVLGAVVAIAGILCIFVTADKSGQQPVFSLIGVV